MPTYEYACRDCGEHLEVVQSFRDDALTVCPNCQGQLRKVFSAAGLIFKGSGWHIKDYATSTRSSSKDSDTSSGGSDTEPTSSGSDSTSSKPAGSSKPASDGPSGGTKTAAATPTPSTEKKSA